MLARVPARVLARVPASSSRVTHLEVMHKVHEEAVTREVTDARGGSARPRCVTRVRGDERGHPVIGDDGVGRRLATECGEALKEDKRASREQHGWAEAGGGVAGGIRRHKPTRALEQIDRDATLHDKADTQPGDLVPKRDVELEEGGERAPTASVAIVGRRNHAH